MGCGTSSDTTGGNEHIIQEVSNTEIENNNSRKTSKEKIEINLKMLQNYVEVELEISEAEASNPFPSIEAKTEELSNFEEDIIRLEEELIKLNEQTKDFGADAIDEVKTHQFFVENGVTDNLSPDQEAKLDLINKKEIVEKELESSRNQKNETMVEVRVLEKKAEHLQQLYERQDGFLDDIFDGKYGSLLESQLERQVEKLEIQRAKILEANYKWRQAQIMLEYARRQLSVAIQKWQSLPLIQSGEVEQRYSMAAETRNNLVAASQNAFGAHRYLESVQFPYITSSEVATLNKAAQYVFTDMQSKPRHDHAAQCFNTTYMRTNALLQWVDMVINTTIMKDLNDVNEKVKDRALKLRRERVRLIKEKIQEMYGTNIELNETLRGRDITALELAKANISHQHAIKTEGQSKVESADLPSHLMAKETLAPVPSNSILFGGQYENLSDQIQNLHTEHRKEMDTFLKGQELNESRMKIKLEDKLIARRQRRARIKLEEKQIEALSN